MAHRTPDWQGRRGLSQILSRFPPGELRPYGPGKYDGLIHQYMDQVASDWDAETIEVPAGDSYAKLNSSQELLDEVEKRASADQQIVTRDEAEYILENVGFVIHYSDQGFVTFMAHKSPESFREA